MINMILIYIYFIILMCKIKYISFMLLIGSGYYLEGKFVKDNENFILI